VKRFMIKGIIAVLALLVALMGCSKQPTTGLSKDEFKQSLNEFTASTTGVVGGFQNDLALQAMLNAPLGSDSPVTFTLGDVYAISQQKKASPTSVRNLVARVIPLSNSGDLTRGKWVYNDRDERWEEDGDYSGDDLVASWPFADSEGGSHTASLVVDWNVGGAPTVRVKDQQGQTVESPTKAKLTLYVDGNDAAHVAGYLNAAFAWYNSSCGLIQEPTSAKLEGRLGGDDYLSFDVSLAVSDSLTSSKGRFGAGSGASSSSVSWELSARGQANRDSSCFIVSFDVSSGSLNYKTSTSDNGNSQSLELNTDFAINYDRHAAPASAELSNGFLKLNGQTAFTFEGTLDDSNHNGVPGENVTVHFADGSSTLEQVLRENGFADFGEEMDSAF